MQLSRQLRSMEQVRTRWLQKQGIGSLAAGVRAAVSSVYDFPDSGTVVDVGGDGMLLAFLLQGRDALRGIVVDRPPLAQKARFNLDEEGVLERCQVKEEHPFTALPAGGDLYVFNRVLRKYGDAEASLLLKNCRCAMSPQSTTIIIEPVALAGNTSWRDSRELASFSGRERTEAEFRALLQNARLRWRRLLPTWDEVSIIEATRE